MSIAPSHTIIIRAKILQENLCPVFFPALFEEGAKKAQSGGVLFEWRAWVIDKCAKRNTI